MLLDMISYIEEYLIAPCGFSIGEAVPDKLSEKYAGCCFNIKQQQIIFRVANVTPTKIGNFVALWKKSTPTLTKSKNIPYNYADLDFCVIYVENQQHNGVFIFPRDVLIQHGILSAHNQIDGKLGFRLYPDWDSPTNNQAIRTQRWQLPHFINLSDKKNIDYNKFCLIINQDIT